jgi:hypothetical protein
MGEEVVEWEKILAPSLKLLLLQIHGKTHPPTYPPWVGRWGLGFRV